MANQLVFNNTYQSTSQACITDLIPPTFSGVSTLTPKSNGSIQVSWSTATDVSNPIEYLIYIALGIVNAATLFQSSNLVTITQSLTKHIFTLGDQATFIIKGQVYTIGVRAKDAVGNIDSNVALLTTTAIGSVDLASVFQSLADQFDALNDTYDSLNNTHDTLNDTHENNNNTQQALNFELETDINNLDLIVSRSGSTAGIEASIEDSNELVAEFEDVEEI